MILRSRRKARNGLAACASIAAQSGRQGVNAPFAAIAAIEAAMTLPSTPAPFGKREALRECVVSTESKRCASLLRRARSRQSARRPQRHPYRGYRPAPLLSRGHDGRRIAMNYRERGIPVLLKEVDAAALQRGIATIRKNYEITMSKGKITAEQLEKTLAFITPTTSYDGFDQVDIVVEAVFENMDLKRSTFTELARVTKPTAYSLRTPRHSTSTSLRPPAGVPPAGDRASLFQARPT